MADIALLVAEEYERRIKNSKKVDREMIIKETNANGDGVNFGGGSFVPAMADKMMKIKIKIMSSKVNGGEGEEKKKMDVFVKWVFEPKSQISLAASDGFFSA